jgi:hypothetical protein
MATCIFCRGGSNHSPPEHIIPEALGCPESAVLRNDEVCPRCNHGLAFLDHALVNSFDIPRLLAGQRGKKGRGPFVNGRKNIYAAPHEGELTLFVNAGPGDVTLPNGRILKAPDGSAQSVVATETITGDRVRVRIRATLLQDPRLPRALHKVALETVAFFHGVEAALDHSLDTVRDYVLTGSGNPRRILAVHCLEQEYRNQLWPPYRFNVDTVSVIRLVAFEFNVDLTPAQARLSSLIEAMAVLGANRKWQILTG